MTNTSGRQLLQILNEQLYEYGLQPITNHENELQGGPATVKPSYSLQ